MVHNWMQDWQSNIAAERCESISFRRETEQVFTIDGAIVPKTTKLKDLGVWISSDLKFSHHCTIVAKKAHQRCNLIYRTFLCRDRVFPMNLFNVYVRPIHGRILRPCIHAYDSG